MQAAHRELPAIIRSSDIKSRRIAELKWPSSPGSAQPCAPRPSHSMAQVEPACATNGAQACSRAAAHALHQGRACAHVPHSRAFLLRGRAIMSALPRRRAGALIRGPYPWFPSRSGWSRSPTDTRYRFWGVKVHDTLHHAIPILWSKSPWTPPKISGAPARSKSPSSCSTSPCVHNPSRPMSPRPSIRRGWNVAPTTYGGLLVIQQLCILAHPPYERTRPSP